jgi:hypothetical protein
LDDGTVTNILAKSQKLTSTVRNETGSTISAFKAVYISGASGNKALVSLAQANSEPASSKTFGVTMASISTNNNGEVICVGLLEKVNTSAYTAGTQLWLSPSSAGGFVTTAPTAPNHSVFIGTVTYSHANNGRVEIRIQNGYELGELHNVSITSVANKDIISYNSSTGLYENRTISALGLQTSVDAAATYAPLASPTFTGDPQAPTPATSDNDTSIATTAFVKAQGYLTSGDSIVLSAGNSITFPDATVQTTATLTGPAGPTGPAGSPWVYRGAYDNFVVYAGNDYVTLNGSSYVFINFIGAAGYGPITHPAAWQLVASKGDTGATGADGTPADLSLYATIASPTFTGTVTIPAGASISGFAPLASPALTGTPTAPTASSATNTTQIATTAYVKAQAYATLASPTFTGTPSAPTATITTNSTQIATTAYVKSNLVNYATTVSPTLTGSPQAPTQSTALESTAIATTAFVKKNIRRPVSTFSGGLTNLAGLEENVAYHSTGDGQHLINLWYAGYYNANGSVVMFKQSDNTQMDFNDGSGYTKAPNGNRWYAAFPNAVVFAVKNDVNDWFIFGDLISTQYSAYGTYISGPNIDTGNTVASGFTDYYGQTVYAYTATNTVENGWGGQTNVSTNPSQGTVMSDNFTYSNNTDTYNLLADGSGGYTLNFVSSSGGGYDPYGTKIGTPYWDSGSGSLLQSIADGNGGSTSIAWDNLAPYPVYGVQVSTTSYNNYGSKTDMIGSSYDVYYDSTYYADGNGGSYESWSVSSGYYLPTGWATTAYFYDTSTQNTSYYYYDQNYNYVYPWKWGFTQADGAGGTSFVESDVAPNGTPASDYFYDTNSNYGRIYADGNYGFYFAS